LAASFLLFIPKSIAEISQTLSLAANLSIEVIAMKTLAVVVLLLGVPASFLKPWQTAAQNTPQAAPTPGAVGSATASPSPAPPDSRLGMEGPVRAEDVFKSIEIFKGKPAAQVLTAMNAIRGTLGVSCTYCHTQYEWDKNDKPAKLKTRKMFDMMGYIEEKYFDHKNKITCWTCHRGHPEQPHPSEQLHEAEKIIHLTPEEEKKPAQEVFKNIQMLRGVPAGRLPLVMNFFSQSLGVKCSHCHVQDQWEKDDVEAKKTARKMLSMVHDVIQQYYGKGGPISCSGCHQGKVKPENGLESPPVQKGL
jgi:Photosynthetic reaction centre cytochrome C subunit